MRILIIRLSSIGDVILTTPILKELKIKYPDIEIDFLVMDKFKSSIEGLSYVDNLIIFNKKESDGILNLIKFAKKLKANKYDYVFDLHDKFRSVIISNVIGGKVLKYKKRSWWKSVLVKMRAIKYQVNDTIIKNYFVPFRELGIEYKGENLEFYFDKEILKEIPSEYKGLPAIAPGASKNTKKWCLEEFGILSKLINEKFKTKVLILGGEEDFKFGEAINKISGDNCINLCGKISLKESGAILSTSKYLVTNDSGPFHIARGVKCKTFVIFGPTSPGMFEFTNGETLIYSGVECSPCSLHGDKECPKKHFKCMKSIKAESIVETIEKTMKE